MLASQLAHMGHCRLGMGLWIQQQRGMRPSEMLKLKACDLMFADNETNTNPHVVLRLGAFVGTKAKREQFVLVHFSEHPVAYSFLRDLFDRTALDAFLFPYSIIQYRALLRKLVTPLTPPGPVLPQKGWR